MQQTYYTVGIIVGTHGIRGEVKVLSRTDFPRERFRQASQLWIRKPGEAPWKRLSVRSARPHKQFWLVAFDGYSNINDVQGFRGQELCVHESELMPLPEGSYYIHQLVGLDVFTDDGRYAGKLVEVLTPGANDVYVVRGPLQKQDLLIPAIPSVILAVNPEQNRMTVHLLPGLLDADDEP